MKLKNILLCAIIVVAAQACDNEAALQPNAPGEGIVFEFPEGDNDWDRDLQQIAGEFGTKCIYKNLTLTDLMRSWTATGSATEYLGQGLINDRQAKLYTQFFKDHVFHFLNPEIAKKVLPNYIYFAYDYCSVNFRADIGLVWHGNPRARYDGMGFWAFCYETSEHVSIMDVPWQWTMFTEAIDVKKNREMVLKNIFNLMVNDGVIVPPAQFAVGGGLDYSTPIVYGAANINNENYYKRRGFPARLTNLVTWVASPSDLYSISNTGPTLTFIDYLWLAFRFSAGEVREAYKDFPLVIQYYELTVKYVKEKYGMDISLIGEMPEGLED